MCMAGGSNKSSKGWDELFKGEDYSAFLRETGRGNIKPVVVVIIISCQELGFSLRLPGKIALLCALPTIVNGAFIISNDVLGDIRRAEMATLRLAYKRMNGAEIPLSIEPEGNIHVVICHVIEGRLLASRP